MIVDDVCHGASAAGRRLQAGGAGLGRREAAARRSPCRVLGLLVCGALLLSVWAAAPAQAEGSLARDLVYRRALERGRELEQRGDHRHALQAFETALVVRPEDPVALCELGWTAFLTGDLARATKTTERALARATQPGERATAFYNLGRIHEAQGQRAEALAAYQKALVLRPSASLKAQVDALAASPLAPLLLEGPFASLADWCQALRTARTPPETCTLDEATGGPSILGTPVRPWRAARILVSGLVGQPKVRVALETAAGWFVTRPPHDAGVMATPLGLETRDALPGEGAEVLVRYVAAWAANERRGARCTEQLIVCGLGAGGPRCTPPIPVREGGCPDPRQAAGSAALEVQFLPGGRLELKPAAGAPPTGPAATLVGTHRLGFP